MRASSTLKVLALRFTTPLTLSSTFPGGSIIGLTYRQLSWRFAHLDLNNRYSLTKRRLILTTWYACVVPYARCSPSPASLTRQLRRRFAQLSILSAVQRMPRAIVETVMILRRRCQQDHACYSL